MKELSIEEKAKRYESSLERCMKLYNEAKANEYNSDIEDYETIFPELRESEDEKIRKALIRFHKSTIDIDGIKGDEIVAWLEKQGEQKPFDYENANIQQKDFAPQEDAPRYSIGDVLCDKSCTILDKDAQPNFEIVDIRNGLYICDKGYIPISQQDEYELVAKKIEQKPTDKVEPKFKIGDFIVNDYCMGRIVEITKDAYLLDTEQGIPFSCHSTRLWDITKDAKDGDVLYSPCLELLWIFKNRDSVYCGCNLNYNDGAFCGEGYFKRPTDAIPATKEQRDTLERAMNDAGWEFDFDKKELKKISQRMVSAEAKEAMYDKPAWSEEDEDRLNSCIDAINAVYKWDVMINWLKSLKDRYTWKPNKEQMKALHDLNLTGNISYAGQGQTLIELYNDLKKLKE